MNLNAFTSHDRRVAALGATVIASLLLGFRAAPAWRVWRADARALAAEQVAGAARDAALLEAFPTALDSLEAREGRVLGIGPALLTGDSPPDAASNLAALIAEIARASSVRLEVVNSRADSSHAEALPRVTADIQATADVAGLAALLRSLESGPLLLAIKHLEVRPQNLAGPADQAEQLFIRLTVEALVLLRQNGTAHAGI